MAAVGVEAVAPFVERPAMWLRLANQGFRCRCFAPLARLDEVQIYAAPNRPVVHRAPGELGPLSVRMNLGRPRSAST